MTDAGLILGSTRVLDGGCVEGSLKFRVQHSALGL